MARPCVQEHPPSPAECPYCAWCALDTSAGKEMRAKWNEELLLDQVEAHPCKAPRRSCGEAHAGMSVEAMVELIRECPPGPWPSDWAKWDCTRDAHIVLLDEAIAQARPADDTPSGRGIVICVNAKPGMSSGKDLPHGYFPGAWVCVQELRRLGCVLPITFAYLGELEWDPELTRLMKPYGVECLDLREIEARDPYPPRILNGWESKVYAINNCSYEEVLYLDADNIPMRDPTYLFDTSQYRYYGSIFWPDVPPYDRQEWLPECVWRNVGLSYRDEVDFESGQFLVNRRICNKELRLAQHINEHSDYFYQFVFGDKSTFHLAWAKLSRNWAIPIRGPGGNQASLFQHDFSHEVLFQHCTRNKPSLHGYPSPGSLLRERECLGHLAELRKLWGGKLWDNREPSPAEAAAIAELEGQVFEYRRDGLDSRPMRLLPDGRIGRGLAKLEVGWTLFVIDDSPRLVITSLEGCPTAVLRPGRQGGWSGRWLEHERCPVHLVPIDGRANV